MTLPPTPHSIPPKLPIRSHQRSGVSRRNMLAAIGLLGGAGVTCACGGLVGIVWLFSRQKSVEETVMKTIPASETPPPTPEAIPMVSRAGWGALPPDHEAPNESGFYSLDNVEGWRVYEDEPANTYQTVIIHHSVIDEGDDIATLQEIQRAHRQDRGWADVAYHYFVGQTGRIYEGRDLRVRGVHVAGHNTGSLGVCLLGDFTRINPTASQINTTHILVQWLARTLNVTHLAGHQDFNPLTQCPGDALIPYLDLIANEANLQRGAGGYVPPADATPSQS